MTATLFVCSSTVAGVLSGAAINVLANVVDGTSVIVIPYASVVAALVIADLASWPLLPQRNVETPRQWVHQAPWRWAVLTGAALGCGAWTRIGFPIWYVLPLIGVATTSFLIAAACWGTYGCIRALASVLLGARQIRAKRGPDVARDLMLGRSIRIAADAIALAAVTVIVVGVVA